MNRRLPLPRRAVVGLIAVASLATAAPPAAAINCAALSSIDDCPSGTGVCEIEATYFITDGVVDCSGRHLKLQNGGWLKVEDGNLLVKADDLYIEGNTNCCGIQAQEGTEDSVGELAIELTGDLDLHGKIRANGDHGGGVIRITAAGNVSLHENGTDGIEADGTGTAGPGIDSASGGQIRVEAGGTIVLHDPVHAEGAGSGENSGGSVELIAGGNITTSLDGHLSAGGRDLGAGTIRLVSRNGSIILGEHIVVDGQSTTSQGGEIDLEATGQIQVNEYLHARGSVPVGSGQAAGGEVSIHAGCGGVVLGANGDIDVTGGDATNGDAAGSVTIEAAGSVTLSSGTVIDAHGKANGANAGQIRVRSGKTLTIDGATINGTGNSNSGGQGEGGAISLSGCTTDIKGTTLIDARGYYGGTIDIFGENAPPATGTQPNTIRSTAQVKATGTHASRNGSTTLRGHVVRRGICTNNVDCWVDADCVQGCETGDCENPKSNPDTEGVVTQFDLTIARSQVSGLGGSCANACP